MLKIKNRRKHNRQAILRHRRRGTTPSLLMPLHNGAYATVTRSLRAPNRASYRTRYAQMFGEWPPGPAVVKELRRWA